MPMNKKRVVYPCGKSFRTKNVLCQAEKNIN